MNKIILAAVAYAGRKSRLAGLIAAIITFPLHAVTITAVSNTAKFPYDLDGTLFSRITSKTIYVMMDGCDVSITRPIKIYWSNWANSWWEDAVAKKVSRSSISIDIPYAFSGGYSRLSGEVVGSNCAAGSTAQIEGTNSGNKHVIPYDPSTHSTYDVTDQLTYNALTPNITSDPQRLFRHTQGVAGKVAVNGQIVAPDRLVVIHGDDLQMSVDSDGYLRVMGKKAGAYSKQIIVTVTVD